MSYGGVSPEFGRKKWIFVFFEISNFNQWSSLYQVFFATIYNIYLETEHFMTTDTALAWQRKLLFFNFPSVYEFITLPKKSLYGAEVMPDISVTASWIRKQKFYYGIYLSTEQAGWIQRIVEFVRYNIPFVENDRNKKSEAFIGRKEDLKDFLERVDKRNRRNKWRQKRENQWSIDGSKPGPSLEQSNALSDDLSE